MSLRTRVTRLLGAHGGRPLRRGLIAAVVVGLLGVGVGATYANWSASVTATSTAGAAQLAITSANVTSTAYTFGNETLTTTGSVTVANTSTTTSTRVPALTLAFSRDSGTADLAADVDLVVWYQANGTCTTSTTVGAGSVTGTWASFPGLTSTLAKSASATYCVRSTIADRQDVAVAGGTLSFVPKVVGTLTVGNFTATASATAPTGQVTRYIYPAAAISATNWYMVKSSNQCMDVSGGGTTSGTAAISYPCKTSDTSNQEWMFTQDGTTGFYDIKPRSATGLRVDVNAATTTGSAVTVRTDASLNGQLWQPQLVATNTYQFVNKLTGFCLTSTTTNSGNVTQAICNGSAAQQHTLTSTGTTVPPVVPLANLQCSAGTLAQTASFTWTSASNGGYTIEAERTSGDWHDVSATTATTASGATITGTLPSSAPMLNWPTGIHAVRITDRNGAVVGTSSVEIKSLWTYRYFEC